MTSPLVFVLAGQSNMIRSGATLTRPTVTADGLPFIGPHPSFPRACFALGYGGNGITYSAIAAGIIRDAYLRMANPTARLFRFDR